MILGIDLQQKHLQQLERLLETFHPELRLLPHHPAVVFQCHPQPLLPLPLLLQFLKLNHKEE
jgi:hypothetical protein